MAVRNESVRLSLEDTNFTSGMARAAAGAAVLNRELNRLDGKNVGKDLDDNARSADNMGSAFKKASPDIDKFSGRLGLLAEAAVVGGPVLLRLGASALPVLTGALTGLGAAAGGIGVTVLAFKGLSDALDALNNYQLEPTAENLQALRIEQDKLGVSGTEFLRYIDALGPELSNLQQLARDGIFPGVENGIDSLLTRLPQVRNIISDLSEGIGDLAANAGASLAGDSFDDFFSYVETDARPTLDAFATSIGNVVLGLANMLTAFAPASRDFTGGLVEATRAFADWSAGLQDNRAFQDFVAYVRQAGPDAVDFFVQTARAFANLAEAAAPFGSAVLPVLTKLVELFADLAGSPIGPALYTSAAALIAFNRAASLAEKSGARLSTTFDGLNKGKAAQGIAGGLGLLALSATDLGDKLGLANTTMNATVGLLVGGPYGAALGAAIGQYQDLNAATAEYTDNITKAHDAIASGDPQQLSDQLANLQTQYDKLLNDVPTNKVDFLGTLLNPAKLIGNNEAMKAYADAISEVKGAQQEGGGIADLFAESIGRTGDSFKVAAGDAQTLSSALATLNGWFSKRAAVRSYKDSIDAFSKGLKDGFTREDAANIDAVGESILQVADKIKNPGARTTFLQSARDQLVDLADHAGPRAAAAIEQVIDKFDAKGLTNPPPTKLSVDDSWVAPKLKRIKGDLDILGKSTVKPQVDANIGPAIKDFNTVGGELNHLNGFTAQTRVTSDTGAAQAAINSVRNLLTGLDGTTAHTYVTTSPRVAERSAEGSTVPKTGKGYADRHLYLLADGEEVISNRYGQADRNRPLLKAINAGANPKREDFALASGGTVTSTAPLFWEAA